MEKKRFNGKMEDLPIMLGFVLSSMERDKDDFIRYSLIFNDPYAVEVRKKQMECYEIIKSTDVLKHQKVVKTQIDAGLVKLRLGLNQMEGYLKLAEGSIDIPLSDFGVKTIRGAVAKSDLEKIIQQGHTLINNLKRNQAVLLLKGLKPETILALEALITELNGLNEKHNTKKNERSRTASDNMTVFNNLSDTLDSILNVGRAMYRGVDNVKLREYTMASLLKRVYSENANSPAPIVPKTGTPS